MKKISILFLICSGLLLKSQTRKGSVLLGGSFNTWQQSQESHDANGINKGKNASSNYNLTLRSGYLITDRVMAGILMTFSRSSGTNDFSSSNYLMSYSNLTESINGGVFGRYYYYPFKNERLAIFGQLFLNYGKGNTWLEIQNNDPYYQQPPSGNNRTSFAGVGFYPGFTYFITQNLAVETTFGDFGYLWSKSVHTAPNGLITRTDLSTSFYSQLNFSFQNVFLGINFYLGGRPSAEKKAE